MMRKRPEQELVQSERLAAVGQTVAGLAHSIKSILFGIEGGVYIVDKGFKTSDLEKLETGWNMVHKNIDKVSSLVVDLLDYSRERTSQLELCSPNMIAEDVCELMEYKARDSSSVDIEFVKNFSPGRPPGESHRKATL